MRAPGFTSLALHQDTTKCTPAPRYLPSPRTRTATCRPPHVPITKVFGTATVVGGVGAQIDEFEKHPAPVPRKSLLAADSGASSLNQFICRAVDLELVESGSAEHCQIIHSDRRFM